VQRQVVWAAGLRIGAEEPKAAEGLNANQSLGDTTVNVEILSLELVAGPYVFPTLRF
jgi:hypothetical protein